ncbi:hypothetical protein FRB94_002057 [Tulasnella sp. JGI-2019a]|nr:hypothetical protein FRB93_002858 [Tulasnella sp. JGI-2019a]KAG9004808.1 hypothetical protein FRB94_002057 [Tulasnella sp. JGI-2019a]KAG9035714.1 hypothetical protein FRB95_010779 [Tulasnella sp. JGI-2019a]
MKYSITSAVVLAWTATLVSAQSAVYGQCGGIGWTGPTTCTNSVCTYSNPYYSQCLPGTATTTSTTSKSTTTTSIKTTTSSTSSKATTTTTAATPTGTQKFKFFGVNESGAEFGNTAWPGTLGKDYIWPAPSSIDYFVGLGFNTFRVPFLMERLNPPATGLTGPFNATYLAGLTTTVNYITGKGAYALIDPHNFMRYNNAIISDSTAFSTWWSNLAKQFVSNSHVVFDLQNEPYGIAATTIFSMMQAAVNSIRAAGATSQLIVVEGTSYTGAWTWTSSGNAAAFTGLKDPNNNIAIEMHQYLDSDGSGTSDVCVSSTIGAERLADATAWLKANNFKGLLGEIGAGSNSACISAVSGALASMQQAGSPWLGALWWAAGPWWGTYFMSIEPPSGVSVSAILPQALEPYLPVSS